MNEQDKDFHEPAAPTSPGIYTIPEDIYHAGPGISKTGLWKIYSKTPAHHRFGERAETKPQRFGKAAHCAVLEPGLFERKFHRGTEDRRGNKWLAAQEIAAAQSKTCCTADEFDDALRLRDAIQRNPLVQRLTAGVPGIELSGYWRDEETGELCRCRPDLYSHELQVMADLKSTGDASPFSFSKSVAEYGYHVQEAFYSQGWHVASNYTAHVQAFIFIAVESKAPFAHQIFELEPSAYAEGEAIAEKALRIYHECAQAEREAIEYYTQLLVKANAAGPDDEAKAKVIGEIVQQRATAIERAWPSYPLGPTALDIPSWAYKHRMATMEGAKP